MEPGSRPLPAETGVVIVGAGFSGVAMAIALLREGIEDFVMLERGPGPGGTWRDNTYPGAACDVRSHLYSFSFAPNPRWTRAYPPQREINQYIAACVERFGIAPHLHVDTEVRTATWDDVAARWHVATRRGSVTAPLLVWASGPLSQPSVPEIPGLESFPGPVFHTAAWDHDTDLTGLRVAVVGTGASAAQVVPAIQPKVAALVVHQRTPPWVAPRLDAPVPHWRQRLYAVLPVAQRLERLRIYLRHELVLPALRGSERMQRAVRGVSLGHLRRQVADPELRDRLTPDYAAGCKRIIISDDYYPALTQDNVEVVAALVEVRGNELVDADGVARPVDALVLATGFQAANPAFASRIIGRGGVSLAETWKEGMAAYLGTAVNGFPNLFLLLGPNTVLGHNSMVFMIESHVRYVLDAVRQFRRRGARTIEVREDAEHRYNDWIQAEMRPTVWTSGGCASWYLDERGRNTTLWPGSTLSFRWRTRRFRPAPYIVRS